MLASMLSLPTSLDYRWRRGLEVLLIVLAVFFTYSPAMDAKFIWDDARFITENHDVVANDGLLNIWVAPSHSQYFPLTHSLVWLQYRLWGANTSGYHIVNIALHAICSLLVWRLGARLKIPGAWLAGLLFAVHPVNVASVAWACEQKNTLSLAFYLLGLTSFAQFLDESRTRSYVLALLFYALALLSKTSVVMFPFALLLLYWWKEKPLRFRELRLVAPFVLITIPAALATVVIQYNRAVGGANVRPEGFLSVLASVGWQLWFYLGKAVFPWGVSPLYPRWIVDPSRISHWLPLAAFILMCATCWCLRSRTWAKCIFAVLAYYAISLFPMYGFFSLAYNVYSLVADHWQYIPLVAVTFAAASGLHFWASQLRAAPQAAVVLATAGLVACLGYYSGREARHYHDEETWSCHVLQLNPGAAVAHFNLGAALNRRGEFAAAMDHFQQAVKLCPEHRNFQLYLAGAYLQAGEIDNCINICQKLIREAPYFTDARLFLADAYIVDQSAPRAEEQLLAILETCPEHAIAYSKLGLIAGDRGDYQRAQECFLHAIRFDSDNAEYQFRLGTARERLGEIDGAMQNYRQAIKLRPGHVEAHNNLGNLLVARGMVDDAIEHYKLAEAAKPTSAMTQYNLGVVYFRVKKLSTAVHHLEKAVALDPASNEARQQLASLYLLINDRESATKQFEYLSRGAHPSTVVCNALGTLYAQQRRWTSAEKQFRRSLELSPGQALVHANLGIVLAQQGDRNAALVQFEEALAIQPDLKIAKDGALRVSSQTAKAVPSMR